MVCITDSGVMNKNKELSIRIGAIVLILWGTKCLVESLISIPTGHWNLNVEIIALPIGMEVFKFGNISRILAIILLTPWLLFNLFVIFDISVIGFFKYENYTKNMLISFAVLLFALWQILLLTNKESKLLFK